MRVSLAESRAREEALIAKCSALAAECRGQARKMMTSLDLSKQDQSTIDALKLELENSWATIDELHENELASKREASELRLEIERLTRDDDRPVTHGRSSTGGTDTEDPFAFQRPRPRRVDAREMEKLLSAKESLTAERATCSSCARASRSACHPSRRRRSRSCRGPGPCRR